MPRYTYTCEHCQETIEISKPMVRAGDPEKCEKCSGELVRDYIADNFFYMAEQKTVGSLADKNTKSFSEERKQTLKDSLDHRKNKYENNN